MITSLSLLGIGIVALAIGLEANAAHDPRDIGWDGVTYAITQREVGETIVTELSRDGMVVAELDQNIDLLCGRDPPLRLDADDDGVVDLVVDDCGHWVYETWRDGGLQQIRAAELPGLASAWGAEVERAGAGGLTLGILLMLAGGVPLALRQGRSELG